MNISKNRYENMFRPSLSEDINKAPLIAFAGPTGSGKTESAMRLARGFVGLGNKFCIIDTEERRALYKKDRYQPWDHLDLKAPFSPENYADAMKAAITKKYKAVIIDSWSHEWAGEGGVSEMAEENIENMVKKMGEDKTSKLTSLAWSKPKLSHKRVMSRLIIRYPELLIFCLRAEPKIKFVKIKENGQERTKIVDVGFKPICEKSFMFEMLVACMMEGLPDGKPGIPINIKPLEIDLRSIFIEEEQICEATGKRLAEWAVGHTQKNQSSTLKETSSTEKEGFPSPEEERQLLDERGMISEAEKPKDGKMEEATILNEMAKIIAKFTLKKELMTWYNENRKSFKERYSQIFFAEWTQLVNDKLEKLK